ncbi:MAG: PEGA domain-containing protein [Fuerstiella sp.]|nr:PEGA domain-containing protein [Fuerstiella sp.]
MPENTDRQTEKSNSSRDNRVITATRYEPVSAARHSPAVRVRTGAILLLVLLSVAVLAAWFVLTAKSVHILTDPESADIDLSGGFNIKLADRFLVRSGDYQVHASNSGFHSVTESIRVGPEQDQQFDFVLQKLPGHLQVRTAPVEGATIWLDDLLRGRSPVIIESIPPGTHSIRILADRYLPVIDAIDIQGRDLKQVLDVTLKPAWAKVSLSSVPAGANVYVDDQIVGQTPMAAEILHGTHRLRIHLSGYKAWHDQLTTVANEPVIIPQVTLQLADAILLLSSSPAQATVTTNGEYQGQTPVELALPPGKPVVVRLFKEGYQRISRTFSLESGDEKRVRLDLTPELSRVAVITEPAGAQLYVDGKLMGSASQTIELTTREHRIRVSKPGYVDHLATVTPRSGIEQQLRVRLK